MPFGLSRRRCVPYRVVFNLLSSPCSLSTSDLAFLTAEEYWKQRDATFADRSIIAMMLAADPTASMASRSGMDSRQAKCPFAGLTKRCSQPGLSLQSLALMQGQLPRWSSGGILVPRSPRPFPQPITPYADLRNRGLFGQCGRLSSAQVLLPCSRLMCGDLICGPQQSCFPGCLAGIIIYISQ